MGSMAGAIDAAAAPCTDDGALAFAAEWSGDILERKVLALRSDQSRTVELVDATGADGLASLFSEEVFVAAPSGMLDRDGGISQGRDRRGVSSLVASGERG
jgi:hypothetical protein